MAALLVLTGAVLLWIRRRTWTDHNVSDPGVTCRPVEYQTRSEHSASGSNRRPCNGRVGLGQNGEPLPCRAAYIES
jgi:hypothetical protein